MTRSTRVGRPRSGGSGTRGAGTCQAADEIIAAQEADPALSNREAGKRLGRSKDWVAKIVTWRTSGSATAYTATPRTRSFASRFMRPRPSRTQRDVRGSGNPLRYSIVPRPALLQNQRSQFDPCRPCWSQSRIGLPRLGLAPFTYDRGRAAITPLTSRSHDTSWQLADDRASCDADRHFALPPEMEICP